MALAELVNLNAEGSGLMGFGDWGRDAGHAQTCSAGA